LDGSKLANTGTVAGIPQNSRSRQVWHDLLEEFEPFAAKAIFVEHEAGYVAAWPSQTIDKAATDGIGDVHEHDRRSARDAFQRCNT
jgi:hypothetical protein